jgi:hypothetical protein
MDPADRGRRIAERLQGMSPEQRQRAMEQLRARGLDHGAGSGREGQDAAAGRGRGGRQGRGASDPEAAASAPAAPLNQSATTIDALFGPLPAVESTGRVWLYENNRLVPVRVRLGITDGQATELLGDGLEPGTQLVTNVTTGQEARPTAGGPAVFPPFMGGRPGQGGSNNRGAGGRGR